MAADVTELHRAITEMAGSGGTRAAELMVEIGMANAPVGDGENGTAGETRDSGFSTPTASGPDLFAWTLGFPTPQALFTDEGTRAHSGNPWLVFNSGGSKIFIKAPRQVAGVTATHWFSQDTVSFENWEACLEQGLGEFAP